MELHHQAAPTVIVAVIVWSGLRELFALHGKMTEKLRDGELDAGEVVKVMQVLVREEAL